MSQWNFKNLDYEDDILKGLLSCQGKPSKCDAVLKCDDGQIYLSKIALVIWSEFWRNLLSDMDNISETVVILLPGFDKESVLEALVFLSNGEIATDYCPRSIQKIIYFVLALIPDMDILSFEIERIFQESEEDTGTVDSDENSDRNINEIHESDNSDDTYSNEFEGVEIGKTYERRHGCKYCLKFFVNKQSLDRHIINKHTKKEKIICSQCGKEFASKDGLKSHLKKHEEGHSFQHPCQICGKIYKNESHLYRHCNITGHTFPNNDKTQPDKRFTKCEICHKWIMDKAYHFEKYHSEKAKTFSCEYENCEFVTLRRDTLYKHEKVRHRDHYRDFTAIQDTFTSKSKLSCKDCGKKFKTITETKEHMALEGCTDNICQKCGKNFNVRHNLLQHIREVHEKANTFVCSYCNSNKAYTQKRNRDRHARTCKENIDREKVESKKAK